LITSKRSDVYPIGKIINESGRRALLNGGIMRKISILFALAVMLAGASVQAQKIQPAPPPVKGIYSVQDQGGGGYIWFNVVTGEFSCNMCEYGFAFDGKGEVKVDGFNVYLGAVTDSYQIFVSVNVWDRQGKAVMEIFQLPNGKADIEPIQEFWTDLNINDNPLACVKTLR